MKKAIIILLIFFTGFTLFAQQKVALVIGNGEYTGISRLNNPVNDANDMETALVRLGFSVEKILNGTLEQMEDAVLNFQRRLSASRNTYGFFYYAGHGVQSSGENYLVPVVADNIRSETQLRERAVSLQFILDSMSNAGNELNMIVLDACRDNPFGWARSGSRGLSGIGHAPTGTIVMYATGANSTAADGSGRNGLFTTHLLRNLGTAGLSVYDVFDKTMDNVINETNGNQHPELSVRFPGATRAFLGTPTGAPAAQQTSRPTQTAQPTQPAQPAPFVPAADPDPVPVTVPINPGFELVNGGTFTMGSPTGETGRSANERQQRNVTVSSFYMGRYLVTQKEYKEVMGDNPSYYKGDDLPVENISWFDAVEYCNKLSEKEGLTPAYTVSGSGKDRVVTWNRQANGYRLPTEAEWEYACRAGTTTVYNTGLTMTDNTGWYSHNSNGRTQPVGQKPANAWGLYDMHGNVREWCWDWHGNYRSSRQTDPAGPTSGTFRVSRGGSWNSGGQYLRSAYRSFADPSVSGSFLGFRVVRD